MTCYRNGSNSSYGTANVGTVSGTSISWGTAVIFQSAYTQYIGIGEGTGTKVGLAYENANFTRSKYRQGTVSGTSISFDTEIEYVARTVYGVAFVNNLPQDRVVFFYQNQIDNRLYVIVGTGDPVTFGTPTVVSAGSLGADFGAAYDSDADLICVAYRDQNSGAGNTGYLTYQTGTFSSATEVTMGAAQTINAVSSTRSVLTYDTNADRIVVSFDEDTAGSGQANPKAFTILNASTNVSSYVGITDQAISSAATGKVVCKGGAITNTGLIPLAPVAGTPVVFKASRLNQTQSTFDSANNKIVIVYKDYTNSSYGTAIVGTVSGSSICFGSPVVFSGTNAVSLPSCVFDPSSNKVVIAYGQGSTGVANVGTVSGTSISFGSAVTFEASDTAEFTSLAYDANAQKVVIAYRGVSNYGYSLVGTVSGTSISFGTKVTFFSAYAEALAITYDANAQKVVIAWYGTSGYGTAIVGTVSGTNISFGSAANYMTSGESKFNTITYDSAAQKVVVAFQDTANSGKPSVAVGTVSGTSISFGTKVAITPNFSSYTSATFDSNQNKVLIAYQDATVREANRSEQLRQGLFQEPLSRLALR